MTTTASPRAWSTPAVSADLVAEVPREAARPAPADRRGAAASRGSVALPSSTNHPRPRAGGCPSTARAAGAGGSGRTCSLVEHRHDDRDPGGSGRAASGLTPASPGPDHRVPGQAADERPGAGEGVVQPAGAGRTTTRSGRGSSSRMQLPVALRVGVHAVDEVVLREEQEGRQPELAVAHRHEVAAEDREDTEVQGALVGRPHGRWRSAGRG